MSALIDIERLQKIFGRKGEKVVIVVPGQDPVVLVPLTEYEQYGQGKRAPSVGELKVNKPPQNHKHQRLSYKLLSQLTRYRVG